jgi:hypothetical protein
MNHTVYSNLRSYYITHGNSGTFIPACVIDLKYGHCEKRIAIFSPDCGSGITWTCIIPGGTYWKLPKGSNMDYGRHPNYTSLRNHLQSVNPLLKCENVHRDYLAFISIIMSYVSMFSIDEGEIDVKQEFDRLFITEKM